MEADIALELDVYDLEWNLQPLTRARSNTWPMPRPEGYVDDPLIDGSTMTGSGESIKPEPTMQRNGQIGGLPSIKKKSSRRNAWGSLSYAELITQAIKSVKDERLTLSQIYEWMTKNVPFFKDKDNSKSSAGWKNSIRHNLSLHNRFVRVPNEGTGKSSWWMINPDAKLGKATRRRATSMETGKYEKKRNRVKKWVEIMRKGKNESNGSSLTVTNNESNEVYTSNTVRAAGTQFQSESLNFRGRATSCASSCGRLSPIPAAPNECDPTYNTVECPPLQAQQMLPTYQLPARVHSYYQTTDYEPPLNNLQETFLEYNASPTISSCHLHQFESCLCNVLQTDVPSMYNQNSLYETSHPDRFIRNEYSSQCVTTSQATLYSQNAGVADPSYIESQHANKVMTPTVNIASSNTLMRNNSLLDDIDEIIRREQYTAVDIVNNALSSALYITKDNPVASTNQHQWIH